MSIDITGSGAFTLLSASPADVPGLVGHGGEKFGIPKQPLELVVLARDC